MPKNLLQSMLKSDLEERILNGASIFALICILFPWISGSWLGGEPLSYSGLQFYTSYIGFFIGLCHILILSQSIIPALQPHTYDIPVTREMLRVWLGCGSTILSLAALSVLINIATEFTSMDIRFGIYGTLIGSLITSIYALWTLSTEGSPVSPMSESRQERRLYPTPPPVEDHRK